MYKQAFIEQLMSKKLHSKENLAPLDRTRTLIDSTNINPLIPNNSF